MTSTQETSTSIIKSDRSGRTRYSQSYKDEVVVAYQQSNMSAAAFAGHCGIKYPTFASWVAKAKRSNASSACNTDGDNQQFILAEFGGTQSDSPLKIELPGGAIVHLSSSSQLGLLAELLKTLS
jgi:hypothetical protein